MSPEIALLLSTTIAATEPAGKNLLPDPSFEISGSRRSKSPQGWGLRPDKKHGLKISYDAEWKTHGKWSLKMDATDKRGHLLCWPKTKFDSCYHFSIDFAPQRGPDDIGLDRVVRVGLWCYGSNVSDRGRDRKVEAINPEGWYRLSMTFVPPWGTTHGALSIEAEKGYKGALWLDNAQLRVRQTPEAVRQKPFPQEEVEAKARALRDPAAVVRELLKVAGHVNAGNEKALLAECSRRLKELDKAPATEAFAEQCRLFLEALDCFENRGYIAWQVKTGLGRYENMRKALDLLAKIPDDSPLHDKAQFFLGRIKYGVALEGGRREEIEKARDHLRPLAKKYSTNELIRMVLGEKIPWGESYRAKALKAPVWAGRQYDGLTRVRDVVHWWIENRQAPTGEMGGGWGDDCEMLRHWGDVYFLTGDERIRRAAALLADGIVREIAPHGYLDHIGDVEHAAEPTSDTALLAGFDYGNPLYIERAMATTRLLRDVWTGVNRHGQRLFRSCWFGARGIRDEMPYAQDVPLNGRALKPVLWLAWYNRDPEAIRLLRELGDAWVENARRTDGGKPKGLLPSAVVFETGEIGGFSGKWWSDGFYYSKWPAYHSEGHLHLAGTASVTGDTKYHWPMQWTLEQIARFRGIGQGELRKKPEGSAEWAVSFIRWHAFRLPVAAWREETGNREHDRDIRGMGNSWLAWRVAGPKQVHTLAYGFSRLEQSVGYNFPLLTSEVISTDRVAVRESGLLFSMATGGYSSNWWPSYHVTWERTDAKLAALVTHTAATKLEISLYSFADRSMDVDARFWRLAPGIYEWRLASEGEGASVTKGALTYRERGQRLVLTVLPSKVFLLTVEQTKPLPPLPDLTADPAISARDLDVLMGRNGDSLVLATIHNIGSEEATGVTARLSDGKGNELCRWTLGRLPAPQALHPSRRTMAKRLNLRAIRTLQLEVAAKGPEICSTNNRVTIQLARPERLDETLDRLFVQTGPVPARFEPLFERALGTYRSLAGGHVDPLALHVLIGAIDVELAGDVDSSGRKLLEGWRDFFAGKLAAIPPADTTTPVCAVELESLQTHALCRTVEDAGASGGKAMTYTSNNAWIEVGVQLPAGRYRVRVRGRGTASTSDAIFIMMDGRHRQRAFFPLDKYTWKDAVFTASRTGHHRIRILHAEPEVLLDRLEVYRR